ncbi:MAG: hypothetical protein ACI83O_000810 [Patescibacteria group bacterium]|jgi:hypothetical protein
MILGNAPISLIGIFAATVACFIFGWLWYGPIFGNTWARNMGFTNKEMNDGAKGMGKKLFIHFLGILISTYVVATLIPLLGVVDIIDIFEFAFVIVLGFYASTSLLAKMLWSGKNFTVFLIDLFYSFFMIVIAAVVLMYLQLFVKFIYNFI